MNKSTNLRLKRVVISIALLALIFVSILLSSKELLGISLAKQLSDQLEQKLHHKLFRDEASIADTQSMMFFIEHFNEKSLSLETQPSNPFQLLVPTSLSILEIDGIKLKTQTAAQDLKKANHLTTFVRVRGADREVSFKYEYEANIGTLGLLFLLSMSLIYFFVFKRVPF